MAEGKGHDDAIQPASGAKLTYHNMGEAPLAERTYHGQDLTGISLGLLQVLWQDRCEVVPACNHTDSVGSGACRTPVVAQLL